MLHIYRVGCGGTDQYSTRAPEPALRLSSSQTALILAAAAPIEGGERGWATKNYSEAGGPFRPEAAYCAAAAGLPVPNTMTFAPIGVRL